MNTLLSAPVAPLLDRLLHEAEAASPATSAAFAHMSEEESHRLLQSRTGYRELYGQLKEFALPVSREVGQLLYMLARAANVRSIVEFGTSFGLSTLCMAAALRDNGGGRLITSEFEPSKIARARDNLAAAGLDDLVEFREGDALQTLAIDLPETIDLVLLDGAKALYPDILDRMESRLRPGAMIVADNADFCPDYLERVRSNGGGYMSVPFADDVELSVRLAGHLLREGH
jgi:predicted O-methyltransferase YrrM